MKLTRTKMKRGCECVGQTIKLTKTCVQPPLVHKLAHDQVKKPCSTPMNKTRYQTPRPVCVRICSRRNLENKCPSKFEPQEPQSKSNISGGWTKFAFKSVVASGLVYWTSSEGLWGDTHETEDLYYRIAETLEPILSSDPDDEQIDLPDLDIIKHNVREAYNFAVFSVMKAVIGVPLAIQKKISGFFFSCDPSEDVNSLGKADQKKVEDKSDSAK